MTKEDAASGDETEGLEGTSWRVEDVGGAGVLDRLPLTVEFHDNGQLSGHGGVNRYRGGYAIEGDQIVFGPVASTKMGGAEAAMRQEHRLLGALAGSCSFSLRYDELVIGDGDRRLRLRRQSEEAH